MGQKLHARAGKHPPLVVDRADGQRTGAQQPFDAAIEAAFRQCEVKRTGQCKIATQHCMYVSAEPHYNRCSGVGDNLPGAMNAMGNGRIRGQRRISSKHRPWPLQDCIVPKSRSE